MMKQCSSTIKRKRTSLERCLISSTDVAANNTTFFFKCFLGLDQRRRKKTDMCFRSLVRVFVILHSGNLNLRICNIVVNIASLGFNSVPNGDVSVVYCQVCCWFYTNHAEIPKKKGSVYGIDSYFKLRRRYDYARNQKITRLLQTFAIMNSLNMTDVVANSATEIEG